MAKEYDDLLQRAGATDDGIPKVRLLEGTGEIDVLDWKSRDIRIHAKTEMEVEMIISQFYFPDWTARIDEEQQNMDIKPSHPDGLISLSVPKGDHEIHLSLRKTAEEFTGQFLSLVTVLFLLVHAAVISVISINQFRPNPT